MPNHVHVVTDEEDAARLADAMSAFARWRNARRSTRGPVWQAAPPPGPLADDKHRSRTVRYVHLNPCRAGLVADPLAWPWSTHRDAVGFVAEPVREREREPARHHRWVSGDPTVDVAGTELPEGVSGDARWDEIREAVAGVCRVGVDALQRRGLARTLAVRTAWFLGFEDVGALQRAVGLSRSAIYRLAETVPARGHVARDPALHACVRAVGDDRFAALPEGDLRRTPGWERYRWHA